MKGMQKSVQAHSISSQQQTCKTLGCTQLLIVNTVLGIWDIQLLLCYQEGDRMHHETCWQTSHVHSISLVHPDSSGSFKVEQRDELGYFIFIRLDLLRWTTVQKLYYTVVGKLVRFSIEKCVKIMWELPMTVQEFIVCCSLLASVAWWRFAVVCPLHNLVLRGIGGFQGNLLCTCFQWNMFLLSWSKQMDTSASFLDF